MFTRTKIVCTIGPSVSSYEKILELIDAGMNVARMNFSHGTHDEHLRTMQFLKKARDEKKVPLAIMLDTHGPKIRVGDLPNGAIAVAAGQKLTLGVDIPIHSIEALKHVRAGSKILFDDGYIGSKAIDDRLTIQFENSGHLKSGKGLNIPGSEVNLPALTEKDIEDLKFGCMHDVDFVAASFVRSKEHILEVKRQLAKNGKPDILVIAKIESTQGVENFDSIISIADGIMVARGDLGVEVDLALVPKLQKMMIRKGYQAAKPVITATQMLESMIQYPRPTRAEVSDVANVMFTTFVPCCVFRTSGFFPRFPTRITLFTLPAMAHTPARFIRSSMPSQ